MRITSSSQPFMRRVRRAPRPGLDRPTVEDAAEVLIAFRGDWGVLQKQDARSYLTGGRFKMYCSEQGIQYIDDLMTDHIEEFMAVLREVGLSPHTLARYRVSFRALAEFQRTHPGYGDGLHDIGRIKPVKLPKVEDLKIPTVAEERKVLAACGHPRDRLIVETLLATGLRVSELCALHTDDLVISDPSYLRVTKSVHNLATTKNRKHRRVTFRASYATLPRRLAAYIEKDRPANVVDRCIFLSLRKPYEPLSPFGVEKLCAKLGDATGVECNPHLLRHTWATRMVDDGADKFHLMEVGGWESVQMLRRYYSASNNREILAKLAKLG